MLLIADRRCGVLLLAERQCSIFDVAGGEVAEEAEETQSDVNVVCSLWMFELSVYIDMNDHLRKVCHDYTTTSRADASDAIPVVLSVLLWL